jgi:hypothetical protein
MKRVSDDLVPGAEVRAVVLVEGVSDRSALEVLAVRRGRDLAGEGVHVVAMDGATNVGRFLDRYGPQGLGVQIAGLYDFAEERFFRRGLERVGLGGEVARIGLAALGFFVCTADLEDELIRAVGAEEVERIVEAEGGIRSFRTLQKQPALRERSLHDQLRRMMSGRSGGKDRFARLMAGAVKLDRVPEPLDAVLEYVRE